MSLNIRGLCVTHKFEWLKKLSRENKILFCGIQESKLVVIRVDTGNRWGCNDVGLDFMESTRRSGGIISFWDKGIFQDITIIKS